MYNKVRFAYHFFVCLDFLKYSFFFSFSLLWTVDRQLARSFASNSYSSVLMLSFLCCACIRPKKVVLGNLGCVCQRPTRHTLGFALHQSIEHDRILRWRRVECMVIRLVRLKTSLLVIFCCHAILKIRHKHRKWKVFIFFSSTLDNVYVSLPWERVNYARTNFLHKRHFCTRVKKNKKNKEEKK